MVSLIIPFFNEEEILAAHAPRLQALKDEAEIIFVDGGSTDASRRVALRTGQVLLAKKGRAAQMNAAAAIAGGDCLLFLHADCFLDKQALQAVKEAIARGAVGGCLTQRLLNGRPVFRAIERLGNRRARKRFIFYGDQAIFVKKEVFFELGGFPEVPVMEDVLFSLLLRRRGRVVVLDEPVYVSARRWERHGFVKTNFSYCLMNVLFFLGVPLGRVKTFYKDAR